MSSDSCPSEALTTPKPSKLTCAVVTTGTPTPKPDWQKRWSVTSTLSISILTTRSPTPASPTITTGSVYLGSDPLLNVPRPLSKRPAKPWNWIQLQPKPIARSDLPQYVTTSTGVLPKATIVERLRLIAITQRAITGLAFI